MKKILTTLCLAGALGFASAQTVTVTESDQKVEKIVRTGHAISLELDEKFVEKLWKKECKEFGKSSKSGKIMVFEAGIIPSLSTMPIKILTKVEGGKNGTIVWMAVDMGSEWITASHPKYASLQKILHDFGVKAYTADINKDIEAAEAALNKASKDFDKSTKEGEKLAKSHAQNAEKKIQLEKQLTDNASEKVQLEKDIEQNTKDKEAGEKAVQKMTKALEDQKARLSNVK